MVGKVLEITDILSPDQKGHFIGNRWMDWNNFRQGKLKDWTETRKYVFATDTTTTSNSTLPWNNKTTVPKLCQVRDNLYANYIASMFPQREWLAWEADNPGDQTKGKEQAIQSYMRFVVDQTNVKVELEKLVLDFIDYGNAFAMPEWIDETVKLEGGGEQTGYVGPSIRRISPLDIVFNPTAPNFKTAPKIIRTLLTTGEVKDMILKDTKTDDER